MGQCFSSSLNRPHYSGHGTADSKSEEKIDESGSIIEGQILKWRNMKVFSLEELKSATKNFSLDTWETEGGFGFVFKGWLDQETLTPAQPGSGIPVAIKMLDPESTLDFQEWQTKQNFLGRLSHPNLLKLLGYCWDEDSLSLVYEFMTKGSLANHLCTSGNPKIEPLSWNTRLKIAIGAARGLAFLHDTERQGIYRYFKASNILLDFKASNILLDENYNAKISDFELPELVGTREMGTNGVTFPEYKATGQLYVKNDVYGFGVVLLEMMTGMMPFEENAIREGILVEVLKPCLSSPKKLKTIMDAKMEGQFSLEASWQAAQLALKCLERDHPEQRPSMKEVVEALEAIQAIQNPHFSAHFSSTSSAEL